MIWESSLSTEPSSVQKIVETELETFKQSASVTVRNKIPSTQDIPIEKPTHWIRVPDVVACFVDMEGSTKLSAATHDNTTAKAYRLFTGTAISIFHHFDAAYIDVKGDGVFALFDSDKVYTALAATVSVKTFVKEHFTPTIRNKLELEIGGHFGIDQKTVLVRRMGLKAHGGRTDRQNEVWAGKPVNMAAKLASRSTGNSLWVSNRYYARIADDKARNSCGCNSESGPKPLWERRDVSEDERFDFDTAYSLGSNWCNKHGLSYCGDLVKLDENGK